MARLIGSSFAHGGTYPRNQLDRVEQQFLPDMRMLPTIGRSRRIKHRLSDLAQVAAVGVDEAEFPLDADRRASRRRKGDLHVSVLPDARVLFRWRA